jgi:hypothetical protein
MNTLIETERKRRLVKKQLKRVAAKLQRSEKPEDFAEYMKVLANISFITRNARGSSSYRFFTVPKGSEPLTKQQIEKI